MNNAFCWEKTRETKRRTNKPIEEHAGVSSRSGGRRLCKHGVGWIGREGVLAGEKEGRVRVAARNLQCAAAVHVQDILHAVQVHQAVAAAERQLASLEMPCLVCYKHPQHSLRQCSRLWAVYACRWIHRSRCAGSVTLRERGAANKPPRSLSTTTSASGCCQHKRDRSVCASHHLVRHSEMGHAPNQDLPSLRPCLTMRGVPPPLSAPNMVLGCFLLLMSRPGSRRLLPHLLLMRARMHRLQG